MKNICAHLPVGEREAFLQNNCEKTEYIAYQRDFTPEEMISIKEDLSVVSLSIRDIEWEKKIAIAEFKYQLDPLKANRSELLVKIQNGTEEVDDCCFKFINTKEKAVIYYDKKGEQVLMRPVTPEDLQRTIFPLLDELGISPSEPE